VHLQTSALSNLFGTQLFTELLDDVRAKFSRSRELAIAPERNGILHLRGEVLGFEFYQPSPKVAGGVGFNRLSGARERRKYVRV